MFKRGLSLAIITVMVSTLGFASFGDSVKKTYSDDELADGIKIEQPAKKTVQDSKSENLMISGTFASPPGISVTMSLVRVEGKDLVDSASSLKTPTIPKFILEADDVTDREKGIIKKFAKAYEKRVIAGIAVEKAQNAFDKAKKDNASAAKLKELKADVDEATKELSDELDAYAAAASDYLEMSEVTIFSNSAVGGKMPTFGTVVKDIQPGYYNLIFKRSDSGRVIKTHAFEVKKAVDLLDIITGTGK